MSGRGGRLVAVVVFFRVTRRIEGWLAFGARSRGSSDRGTPVSSCAGASPRSIGARRYNDMTQTLVASLRGKIVAPPKKSRRIRGAWGLGTQQDRAPRLGPERLRQLLRSQG